MLIGELVLVVVTVVIAIAVVLCALGVIPRNSIVGLRIPSLFESDAAWRAGPRAAIVPTAAAAVVNVVIGVVAMMAPSRDGGGSVPVFVVLLVLVAGVFIGAFIGSRAARRVSAQ